MALNAAHNLSPVFFFQKIMSDSEESKRSVMELKGDGSAIRSRMIRDCFEAIQAHDSKLASDLIDYISYAGIDLNLHAEMYFDGVCTLFSSAKG